MDHKYIVIELQVDQSNNVANIVTSYDNVNDAYSKYHMILASAAISQLPKHTAVVLNEMGDVLRTECFNHEVQTQFSGDNL